MKGHATKLIEITEHNAEKIAEAMAQGRAGESQDPHVS